jgi:hypothetical protein
MISFEDFKYGEKQVPEHYADKKVFFENLRKQFHEELQNSPENKAFLHKYEPKSVDYFLLHYAEMKARLCESYKYYTDELRKKEFKYRHKTEEAFNLIRQKKLFNLQLLWRAEKVKIPEINMCYDFQFWENHVDVCPFIPAITEDEVEVLKQYLKSDSYAEEPLFFWGWQYYEENMDRNEEGDFDKMPVWYDFYDTRLGTGHMLLLPDIRSKKEEYYMSFARKEFHRQIEEKKKTNPPKPYVPPPPALAIDTAQMLEFAKKFEPDRHIVELFRANHEINKERHENNAEIDSSEIDQAVWLLEEAEESVYMPGGMEWRQAIMRCAQNYLNNIIVNQLDAVFEEYQTLSGLGVRKGKTLEQIRKDYENDPSVKAIRDFILRGREICSEPRDFNF